METGEGQSVAPAEASALSSEPALTSESTGADTGAVENLAASTSDGSTPAESDALSLSDDGADDEGADDDAADGTAEGQSRSQRRLQRQIEAWLADPEKAPKALTEVVNRQVKTVLEQTERQRSEAEAARAAEEQTRAGQQAQADALVEFLGKDGDVERLTGQWQQLSARILRELANPTPDPSIDLDKLTVEANEMQAEIERLTRNHRMANQIGRNLWSVWETDFKRLAELPEMKANPAAREKYLAQAGSVYEGVKTVIDTAVADHDAKRDAEVKEIKASAAASERALKAEVRAWRVKAGDLVTDSGGNGAVPGGAGSRLAALIKAAGGEEAFAERAMRGDYAHLNLTGE